MANPQKKAASQPTAPQKPCEALTEESYVDRAEKVIRDLKEKNQLKVTTSQIRNILSMVNQLYNDVIMTTDEKLSADIQAQLRYLKIKIVYAAGRNIDVRRFTEESQIDKLIDHIDGNRKKFILYAHYMEALVAYHRFYGGNE